MNQKDIKIFFRKSYLIIVDVGGVDFFWEGYKKNPILIKNRGFVTASPSRIQGAN